MAIAKPIPEDDIYTHEVLTDCISVTRKNPTDISPQEFFIPLDEIEDYIRWCRKEFGDRGDGWDFGLGRRGLYWSGPGPRRAHGHIEIFNAKLLMMWKLWHG